MLYEIIGGGLLPPFAGVEATTATEVVQVTDVSGEKVTEINVITQASAEIKPAYTNIGKPAGGSTTATGDVTFAVVTAMVGKLRCALIVKKVYVR